MLFTLNSMALPRYRANNTPKPSGSANSTSGTTSPAPAKGNSTASQSASKDIPKWIIPLGIAYLVIRGLTIIAKLNIVFWEWIIILGLAVVAIVNLLSGKQKFISLITIVVIGCILWGNDHNIKSNTSEQSAGQQEQVAPPSPTPTPEYTRYSARGGRELKSLSQELEIAPYSEEICLSVIKDTYGFYISQSVLINGKEFFGGESSRSSECHPLDEFGGVEKKKKVKVKVEVPLIMSPIKGGKEKGDLYKFVQEQGGEASYPVIRPK